jgi:hypothetical protein
MQKEMMDKKAAPIDAGEIRGKSGANPGEIRGKAGQKSLSPEQMKAFNMVSKQALEFLLEDNNAKLIVAKAQQSDPQTAIVESIRPVMQGIWQAAEQSGVKLDLPVFLAAALNVITILADMMAVQGVIPEDQVAQLAQSAAQEAVKQHNAEVPQESQPAGLAGMAQGGM